MSATPARRDAAHLADLATAIQSEHDAATAAARTAIGHAVRCGELLAEAKAQVPHGGWAGWLAEHFPASDRTARGYMRLAAHADDLANRQGLADLGIEGALKQLAEPKDSDDVARRRVQHVAAEDDLRDGLRAWAAAYPDEVDIAFTAVCITYNQLEQAGAHTDFGYRDFDAYVADRLGDVEAELSEFQLDRTSCRADLIGHVQAILSDATEAAAELLEDEPPAGLDHLARAEWYICRADAAVADDARRLFELADANPGTDLDTAARRYAHLLLAQPEPWGELSDAKDWARQEFKAALRDAEKREADTGRAAA